MTASTILSLVLALVKLANLLFGWLHDNALIKEGEDRADCQGPRRNGRSDRPRSARSRIDLPT
jgi:hypothetical protein